MTTNLSGIFPVVPTPLNEDESFDEKGFEALLSWSLEKKFHGLTVLGSNGEGPYFSPEEKARVFDSAARILNGKLPWLAGTGTIGTRETVELSRYALKAGAAACLISLSTFYPLSFERVYHHYKTVAEKSGAPVLYYNYPACTRIQLSVPQMIKLCECDGIVGIKETLLNLKIIRAHIDGVKKKPFFVFSGTSYLMPEVMRMGGAGAICPIPLLEPEFSIALYDAVKNSDSVKTAVLEKEIFRTLPLFSKNASPAAGKMLKRLAALGLAPDSTAGSAQAMLKEFLRLYGILMTARVKSPLPQLAPEQKILVKQVFGALNKHDG